MNSVDIAMASAQRSPLQRMADAVPKCLKRALMPFVLSRLVVILILAVAPMIAQVPVERWGKDDSVAIKLSGQAIADGLRRVAIGNDSGWYYSIAHDGYERRLFDTSKQANWAFFPLHPILWKTAAALTGEWVWSGILLSNLLWLAGLSFLWLLTLRLAHSQRLADQATLFAAFWPTSYFTMLPHTEALFFALVTASFLAALAQRWWFAGLLGLCAGATRLNGLFLAPALFMRWLKGDRQVADLLKLMLAAGGLAAFAAYLWRITGNPLAFKDIQVAWGRDWHAPWSALLDYINRPHKIITPWNPRMLHFGITLLAICSSVTCWRHGWRGLTVFTLLTLLAPLCTGTLVSMTRYAGVAPGIYLALALWSERWPRFGQVWMAMSAMSLALLVTLFALGINVGGA
ncbi:hypothetical protein [Dyella choica]|uniref:Glycosyltransferase RgtA/B/C/D-like domain-containing protein n=1 Tax=Dyella choica TaxID=1927959 RepID=A0A432M636_9GAMM|nr:hypothetical protein [Dyella choica]RUL74869.1 hypothetical protein EKH80_12350 [Dyella choica]